MTLWNREATTTSAAAISVIRPARSGARDVEASRRGVAARRGRALEPVGECEIGPVADEERDSVPGVEQPVDGLGHPQS